ncbi:hypothetical protein GCM10010912_66790 [Paenibacillus albidus]|uniref:Uncharacterized protein n=1 Tax=Paenibacillus albidus TaxID=2041023 RepID=A0A917FVV0_9BACL|nr:hypothetical protein GCM10010912_66790 [Paenibacillus albidus]
MGIPNLMYSQSAPLWFPVVLVAVGVCLILLLWFVFKKIN